MSDLAQDYTTLDVPEVLLRLFHPRPESGLFNPPTSAQEILIPVDPGVAIGARFYAAGATEPTLLFFHGNGEIVADYEDLGPVYTQQSYNFFPVDYRGYGRSEGKPSEKGILSDARAARAWPARKAARSHRITRAWRPGESR